MKKIVLFAVIFLISSTQCFARLGETVRQAETRYGRAIAAPVKRGNILTAKYRTDLFHVSIDFQKGIAVAISYQLRNGEKMSMKRIERLLRENGVREDESSHALKAIWYFQPKMRKPGVVEFIDAPGKTSASYSLTENILYLKSISSR